MLPSRRSFLAASAAGLLAGCPRSKPRVVVYCAQDREFAIDLLGEFSKENGIDVVPKFDTEANKSVGLYREIVAEKNHPRCDVFWNNEIISTIRLQGQELLAEYLSPSSSKYPTWAIGKEHTWTAFASRARVLIVNTRLLPSQKERPRSILELTDRRWRDQVVMAKPQFGTTATQTACLFEVLGSDPAKAFHLALKDNGLHLAPGNKQVAEWVSLGRTPTGKPVAIGLTDTDDAVIEKKAGKDVAIIFPDRESTRERMGTLFIPNTLALVRGCPNGEAGQKLIDFLLGADVEKRLAEGPSAQIPLNPLVRAELPPDILTPRDVQVMAVNWTAAARRWDEAQAFVTKTFATG